MTAHADPVCLHGGAACDLINQWYREGTAAGNVGDFYDNRDRGHSRLKTAKFPQLQVVQYSEQQMARRDDWGAQVEVRRQVTIGNSSTARNVKKGGSNVRAAYYFDPKAMRFLHTQYRSNNLYVYPEHVDHDVGHNGCPGYGDLFPTNSPYVVISQGSSGSDLAFVRAFAHTVAAFRPEVKKKLIQAGVLMPILQAIFRASNKHVASANQYLSGEAHPSAFESNNVNILKMVRAAHDIRLDSIPPIVQMKIRDEDGGAVATGALSEQLADTPAVIARIIRRPAYRRRMVISAHTSYDLNRRPLTYRWVILRGDPQRIAIHTREGGAVAELSVAYHPRRPVAAGRAFASNRVDIGVFVHNGVAYSAPAFITFFYPDHELRTYDPEGRLLEIYYNAGDQCLTVSKWPLLIDTILADSDSLPTRLWQGRFDQAQRKALKGIADQVKDATATIDEAEVAVAVADHDHDAQVKAMQFLQEQADQSKSPEDHEFEMGNLKDRVADAAARLKRARRTSASASLALRTILRTKNPAFGRLQFNWFIFQQLYALKADPGLYINNADAIDAWVATHPAGTEKFHAARYRLQKMGVLGSAGDKAYLGRRPSAGAGLSAYERHQLERFNFLILTEAFYADSVGGYETKNYVDPHLDKPKPYRDVYRYDEHGQLVDRTRIEE